MGLGDILCDFGGDTSCHSLDRIGDRERKWCARIIWFFIFFVALCMLVLQIVSVISRYKQHEVIVDTTLEFSPLPFPAVTICNLNLVPKSRLPKNSSLTDLIQLYQNLITSDLSNATVRNSLCKSQSSPDVMTYCNVMVNASITIHNKEKTKRKKRSTVSPTKPILYWQSHLQHGLPVFLKKSVQRDLLARDAEDMILDCVLNQEACITETIGTFDDVNGMCVTINPPDNFTVKADGPLNGLSVLVDVNVSDYLPITDVQGVRIFLHDQDKGYQLESSGFYAAVGARTSFAVRMLSSSRLGPPFGDCYSSEESGITDTYYFRGKYTINGCMKTCLQKQIIKQCKCRLVGYGNPPGKEAEICWETNLTCALNLQQTLNDKSMLTKDICGCPPPCETQDYVHTVSSAVWPTQTAADTQKCISTKGTCAEDPFMYFSTNTLQLEIYYDSLNYNKYEERPDYLLIDLFSDIGAYMGLFLGASFCTCFEIFSLIITICLYTCRLTKKNIELKKEEEETRKKTGLSSPKKSAIPRATKLKTTNIDAA